MTDEALRNLQSFTVALSARLTEIEAHLLTIRQLLQGVGIPADAYDRLHAPIAEALRTPHVEQVTALADALREQQRQIADLLASTRTRPQ